MPMVKCPKCGLPFYVEPINYTSYRSCPYCYTSVKVVGVKSGSIKVIQCPRCETFQATKSSGKVKCKICGYRIDMGKVKVHVSVDNARDASIIVRNLNLSRGGRKSSNPKSLTVES